MDKRIGYIVMPPGTGKSYNHFPSHNAYDSSTVVPRDSTAELRTEKKNALETGDWTRFDKIWSALLSAKLPDSAVVMIPSPDIATHTTWRHVAVLRLHRAEWLSNLRRRGEGPERYEKLWKQAGEIGRTLMNNTDIQNVILEEAADFSYEIYIEDQEREFKEFEEGFNDAFHPPAEKAAYDRGDGQD